MAATIDDRLFGQALAKSAANGVWIGARPSVRNSGSNAITVDAHDGLVLGGRVIQPTAATVITGLTPTPGTIYYVYAFSLAGVCQYESASTVVPDDAHTFKSTDQRYRYVGFYVGDQLSHVASCATNELTNITATAQPEWIGNPPSLRWKNATTVTVGAHMGMLVNGMRSVAFGPVDVTITPAASTQYYCYAWTGTSSQIAYELVTTAPTAQVKTGDSTHRLVGACKSDGSSNLIPFYDNADPGDQQEQFYGQWVGNAPTLRWKDDTHVTVGAHAGMRSESTRGKPNGETDVTVSGGAANAFWYIYAHVSANDGTVAYEASATAPDSANGYQYKTSDPTRRFVGTVPTDGSSHVIPFRTTRGRLIYVPQTIVVNALNTASLGAPATVALTAYVPPHVRMTILLVDVNQGSSPITAAVVEHGVSLGEIAMGSAGSSTGTNTCVFECACDASQQIDYATSSNASGDSISIAVYGFVEP